MEDELQRYADANPMFSGLRMPEVEQGAVIFKHPGLGDIREKDIEDTMRARGMSRAEVFEVLGIPAGTK